MHVILYIQYVTLIHVVALAGQPNITNRKSVASYGDEKHQPFLIQIPTLIDTKLDYVMFIPPLFTLLCRVSFMVYLIVNEFDCFLWTCVVRAH